MRDQLKSVWRCILTKNYSEDTVATIMYLLAKTNTPEKNIKQSVRDIETRTERRRNLSKTKQTKQIIKKSKELEINLVLFSFQYIA